MVGGFVAAVPGTACCKTSSLVVALQSMLLTLILLSALLPFYRPASTIQALLSGRTIGDVLGTDKQTREPGVRVEP